MVSYVLHSFLVSHHLSPNLKKAKNSLLGKIVLSMTNSKNIQEIEKADEYDERLDGLIV